MKALLLRDLALAIKAGGGFGLSLAFFLIVTVLIPFGVGPDTGILREVASGTVASTAPAMKAAVPTMTPPTIAEVFPASS